MRKFTHEEILTRQKIQKQKARLPFQVVLNNIRSLYNVGSIFRTADGVGVEKLWLCGITGCPPEKMIAKTALGAEHAVDWEYHDDCLEVIRGIKQKGFQIVLLEQIEGSLPYEEFMPRSPVCLVMGHEVEGVSGELLKLSDAAIEIEMAGLKNSLNVSVAFGIVAYRIRYCLKTTAL